MTDKENLFISGKPNIFISILHSRARLCSEARLVRTRRTLWCPLGTLGTDCHASWVTGLEIFPWQYFELRALSCAVFRRGVGSRVRQALLFSCELSFPPISLYRSLCRICFYCTLAHFGSSRVIHFLTVCDHMRGCCRWCKSSAFSWTKNQPVMFDVLC